MCASEFGYLEHILHFSAEEMAEEVHELDPFHSLLANLTKNSANESVPMDLKSVNFAFQLKSVVYNHEKSILHTRLHLSLVSNVDIEIITGSLVVYEKL